MRINYIFDGIYYDYEVSGKSYKRAIYEILNNQSKESLIDALMCADMCSLDLREMFKEELKDYFKKIAYKEFISGRD